MEAAENQTLPEIKANGLTLFLVELFQQLFQMEYPDFQLLLRHRFWLFQPSV